MNANVPHRIIQVLAKLEAAKREVSEIKQDKAKVMGGGADIILYNQVDGIAKLGEDEEDKEYKAQVLIDDAIADDDFFGAKSSDITKVSASGDLGQGDSSAFLLLLLGMCGGEGSKEAAVGTEVHAITAGSWQTLSEVEAAETTRYITEIIFKKSACPSLEAARKWVKKLMNFVNSSLSVAALSFEYRGHLLRLLILILKNCAEIESGKGWSFFLATTDEKRDYMQVMNEVRSDTGAKRQSAVNIAEFYTVLTSCHKRLLSLQMTELYTKEYLKVGDGLELHLMLILELWSTLTDLNPKATSQTLFEHLPLLLASNELPEALAIKCIGMLETALTAVIASESIKSVKVDTPLIKSVLLVDLEQPNERAYGVKTRR